MLIIEAKERKRLTKKIKTEYMCLTPGQVWQIRIGTQRVVILADKENTETIFVGKGK